jgi:hypothetical protein
MKMSEQTFTALSTMLKIQMDKLDIETIVNNYETGNFPRAEFCKDVQKRFCFDLFYSCPSEEKTKVIDKINAENFKSDQLYTSLKKICPKLTIR